MNSIILILFSLFAANISPYNMEQEKVQLLIKIDGIKKVGGAIRVGLYDRAEGYLEENTVVEGKVIDVDKKEMLCAFELIPGKEYAVALMHDKNGNEKMDKNIFGYPQEKYGFSQNPNIWFRAPSFKECSFRIDEDSEIVIKI